MVDDLTAYRCGWCHNPQQPANSEQVFAHQRWFCCTRCFLAWAKRYWTKEEEKIIKEVLER